MTTLFAWLGSNDIKGAEENRDAAIASALQATSYQKLILLSNYDQKKTGLFIEWLSKKTEIKIEIHQIQLSSPTKHSEIYSACVDILSQENKQCPNAEWTFHLSPGTPAMHAVWVILAKTQFPAKLIESSPEAGVQEVDLPFEISADYLPAINKIESHSASILSLEHLENDPDFEGIYFRSKEMQEVFALALRAACTSLPVIIEGDSGTGKELVATVIHRKSERAQKPIITVNCGAIPKDLVESELFGHLKGAFSGAVQNKKGLFKAANGGTIFLDEIGELPLNAQVKLLRVLQEQKVMPVGATQEESIDVRIIAATNKDLRKEIEGGDFREDLYYRLAVLPIKVPPLKSRTSDISLLAEKLLEIVTSSVSKGKDRVKRKFSASALNLLKKYSWPGNVRELLNVIQRIVVLEDAEIISDQQIKKYLPADSALKQVQVSESLPTDFDIQKELAKVFNHYYTLAKAKTSKQVEIAKMLGLPSHQTLQSWVKRYKKKA